MNFNKTLFNKDDVVLIAVSGGKDSVVLLDFLSKLKAVKLQVVHFNHKLRGADSERDAQFVAALARQYELPFFLGFADVKKYADEHKLSLEDAARECRYDYFLKTALKTNTNKIALAHNKNDQVETIIMRFLRGAAGKGLSGIPERRPLGQAEIVRPLLGVSRAAIDKYALENTLENIEDSSNSELVFLRNKIRHELIPFLKKYNDNLEETVLRMSDILKDEDTYLQNQALVAYAEVLLQAEPLAIKLDNRSLKNYDKALQRRIVRLGIEKLFGYLPTISMLYIENFLDNELSVIALDDDGNLLVKK